MHTRYIIYTDGEPYIRVTHNLHMHTRYIFVGARADATFLVSQPTYAYKIYQHLLLISNGASSSQPTYAYKIYRFHFHITVMGCITHNLHMHTRYIDGNKTTLQQLDLTTYICIQDISAFAITGLVLFALTTYICIQDISHMVCHILRCTQLTTYICIQDISSNKYKYKLPTRIKFVGFIPCREYLLFYIRNLCILSRLKDAEPPLISVRISYVFFVCFSFALLIFKVFSIMSSIFFIPIF